MLAPDVSLKTLKSALCPPVEELVESTVRYLVSAESGLKSAAVVKRARQPLSHAFFTQVQEASHPLKQGPRGSLELDVFPRTLPQMSAQHTLLRDAGKFKGKSINF